MLMFISINNNSIHIKQDQNKTKAVRHILTAFDIIKFAYLKNCILSFYYTNTLFF